MSGRHGEKDEPIQGSCGKDSSVHAEPQEGQLRMGSEIRSQESAVDQPVHQHGDRIPQRTGEARLIWESPLGTKRGYLDEPGPRFVDVEGEAELEAMRWERGLSTIDSQRAMAGKVDPARKMPGTP
jgi:hypothetical protein